MGSLNSQLRYTANPSDIVLTVVAKEFEPMRGQAIAFIRLRFERRLAHAGGFAVGEN